MRMRQPDAVLCVKCELVAELPDFYVKYPFSVGQGWCNLAIVKGHTRREARTQSYRSQELLRQRGRQQKIRSGSNFYR